MYLFGPFLALMSTVVTAVPTDNLQPRQYGPAAHLFKMKNFEGDQYSVPGNGDCTDLYNIYGTFVDHVQSILTEPDYSCRFYAGHDCTTDVPSFEKGTKDYVVCVKELDPPYQGTLNSVNCSRIPE